MYASLAGVAAVERLRDAAERQRVAEADEVRAIADLAREHSWSTDDDLDVLGERPVRLGADGSPLVGEFLPLEVAAIKRISVSAATWLIRDVLDVESRHPALWRQVLSGGVRPYQAFQLAQLTARYDLSREQAGAIDTRLEPRLGRIAWGRVMRLARGLIAAHAPQQHDAAVAAAREARYVRSAPAEESAVTDLWARLATDDARRLESTIQAIARSLATLGDTDELDVRRSKALGILATPQRATSLLTGRDDERYLPRAKVYLHLPVDAAAATLATTRHAVAPETADVARLTLPGGTIARGEQLGPLTRAQLIELFGTHRITVTPVIQADGEPAVDSYEIPDRMRAAVTLRDGYEVFPYSTRAARGLDLDHTDPFVTGARLQTRPDNLGPLTRRVHRAKTARRWSVTQPRAGVFWWRSPHGLTHRVTREGTDDLDDYSPLERAWLWHRDTS